MKTKSLLSIAAAASLTAFVSSLLITQDLVAGTEALVVTMAILTLVHEYTPRTHFVVTPVSQKSERGFRSAETYPARGLSPRVMRKEHAPLTA